MNEYTVALPPLGAEPPTLTKWEREYSAFLRLLPELLKTHRGQYAAVHDGQVVATGPDQIALALDVWGRVGYVPIHVGLVTDEPSPPERLPHYRELRRGPA